MDAALSFLFDLEVVDLRDKFEVEPIEGKPTMVRSVIGIRLVRLAEFYVFISVFMGGIGLYLVRGFEWRGRVGWGKGARVEQVERAPKGWPKNKKLAFLAANYPL